MAMQVVADLFLGFRDLCLAIVKPVAEESCSMRRDCGNNGHLRMLFLQVPTRNLPLGRHNAFQA